MGQTPTLLCNKGAEENSAAPCAGIPEGFPMKQGLGTAGKCLLGKLGDAVCCTAESHPCIQTCVDGEETVKPRRNH